MLRLGKGFEQSWIIFIETTITGAAVWTRCRYTLHNVRIQLSYVTRYFQAANLICSMISQFHLAWLYYRLNIRNILCKELKILNI